MKCLNIHFFQKFFFKKVCSTILTQKAIKELPNNLEENDCFTDISFHHQKLPFPIKSYNLAPYINHSPNLKVLFKQGVDLSNLEKKFDVANFIIKLDNESFLKKINFYNTKLYLKDQLGRIITRCPEILMELEQNIDVRLYYFKSKLFSDESISIMIIKTPKLLITPIKSLDENIGFIQKLFQLDGKELRHVISRLPKIIFHSRFSLQENVLSLDQFLGFKKDEIKLILLSDPRILIAGKYEIQQRFTYLHNTMKLTHDHLLHWPTILRTRISTIKPRHEFLVSINKNQYHKKLEHFVPLQALAIGDDIQFCTEVAKVPLQLYNDFLKTL